MGSYPCAKEYGQWVILVVGRQLDQMILEVFFNLNDLLLILLLFLP